MVKRLLFTAVALTLITTMFALAPQVKIAGLSKSVASVTEKTERSAETTTSVADSYEAPDPGAQKPSLQAAIRAAAGEGFADCNLLGKAEAAPERFGKFVGTAVEGTAPAMRPMNIKPAAEGAANVVTGTIISSDLNYKGVRYSYRMNLEESETQGVWYLSGVYGVGDSVRVAIDAAAGKVTIPQQKIYEHSTYGEVSIVPLTVNDNGGFVLPSSDLEGTIDADGSMHFGMWGVCVTQRDTVDGKLVAGEYFGRLFNIFSESTFAVPNTVVTCNNISQNKIVMYEVYMEQTQPNEVIFNGLGNMAGNDVLTARVTADKAIKVSPQTMYTNMFYGPFLNYPAEFTLDAATEKYKVKVDTKSPMAFKYEGEGTYSIPGWVIAAKAGPSSYIGYAYSDVTLTTELAMTYPEPVKMTMPGTGTEADPYIVTSTSDIEAISQQLENGESFAGTWFAMGSDIDFSGVSPTGYIPMGDANTPFQGTFNGAGHKITNFHADGKGFYSTGFFGNIGADGTVCNITFENAVVTASGYNMGIAAAFSSGTIHNINVVRSTVDCNGELGGGIVGETDGGAIAACSFSGAVTSMGSAAGIVAEARNTTITDCAVRANITIDGAQSTASNKEGAGIAGTGFRATIERCYVSGMISDGLGYDHLAGICSYAYQTKIHQCFNTAPISAHRAVLGSAQSPDDGDTYTGGIVAFTSGSEITDCYNTGLIMKPERSNYVGGIAGYLAVGYSFTGSNPAVMINITDITNCYNSGQIICTSDESHRGIYGGTFISNSYSGPTPEEACLHNVWFDQQVNGFASEKYGKQTRDLTSSLPDGFSAEIWHQEAGRYPVLRSCGAGSQAYELSSLPLTLRPNDTSEKVKEYFELGSGDYTSWTLSFDEEAGETATETASLRMEGSKVIVKDKYDNAVVNATTADGWGLKLYRLSLVPKLYEGEGTADDPYLLRTATDWKNLHEAVGVYAQMHRGDHFAMTNDIDFAADTVTFHGVGYGTAHEFAGTLDGRGHAVHGLTIDAGVYDESGAATNNSLVYNGLFGIINTDGTVRNVTMAADNNLLLSSYGGAIAGLSQGLIEGCRNYAEVKGIRSNIGGIVGVNYDGGSVRDCYNAGNVYYGMTSAGGITGYNRQTATIESCQNDGDVVNKVINSISAKTKSNTVGGIAGNNYGVIDLAVNNGHVRGYNSVGGIVGVNNGYYGGGTITRTLNNGFAYSIDTDVRRGGIVGYYNGHGTIADNIYDSSINVNGAANNNGTEGMKGLSSSELVSGTAIEGLPADDFDFTAGGYPVLKKFAEEKASKALRSMYVAFAPKVMRTNVTQNTALSTAEGITFALAEATADAPGAFAIADGMLKVTKPEGLTLATDSLTAQLGDTYFKSFRINAIPEILKGAGVAEDPYLIETPADWNKLAEFMEESKWEYSGNYFRLTGDLDFAGDSIKVVAVNGVNFQGVMDGEGHSIKNYVYRNPNSTATRLQGPNFYRGWKLGVIGTLGSTGTFKNTVLDGSIEGSSYIASAVGENYGIVDNIINLGSVSTISNYGAGITIYNYPGAVVRNCVNKGTVTTKTNYASGISYENKADALIEDCVNEGSITAGTTYGCGIVYNNFGGIRRSVNRGSIMATGSISGIASTVGKTGWLDSCDNYADFDLLNIAKPGTGVFGVANTLTARTDAENGDGNGFIRNCHNYGNLTAKSNVVGCLGTINAGWEIADCGNTGNLATDPAATSAAAYGFTTKITGNKTKGSETIDLMSTMDRCFNTGNISASYAKTSGLVGEAAKYSRISDCFNTGNIVNRTTGLTTAGIVSQANGLIERCFNTGNIESTGNSIGGIFGYLASGELDYPAQVLNCFNLGNITSHYTGTNTNGNAGGLGGYLSTIKDDAPHVVRGCVNAGNVTANKRVGGLFAGAFYPGSVVEDCYNLGKVTCLEPDESGRYYWSGTTFTNNYTRVVNGDTIFMLENHRRVYYDKTVNPGSQFRNAIGSAKTTLQLRELLASSDFEASSFGGYPIHNIWKDCDTAAVASAMILFTSDDQNYEKVKGHITLVGPAGAEWTSVDLNNDSTTVGYAEAFAGTSGEPSTRVSIEGDQAKTLAVGKAVITCSYAGMHRNFVVDIKEPGTVGIDEIFDGKEVKATEIYDLEGRRVVTTIPGSVYIVRTLYTDGTMKVAKQIARD